MMIAIVQPSWSQSGKDDLKIVQDFNLMNTDHQSLSLASFPSAKGFIIVFTCNHCPFAKLYRQRLNDLNKKYKKLGVPLLAINSMDSVLYQDEGIDWMRKAARSQKFKFAYLQDAKQSVAKDFGAQHTPQAYVIWKENNQWVIKYSGSIDNNGEHPKMATPYIANAVDELLNGKKVTLDKTESFGCKIIFRK
jgi:peroxiredoxin